MKKALALIAISFGLWSHAQTSRFPPINLYGGDPTGNVCAGNLIQQSSTTGLIYTCQGGHMKTGGGIGNPAGPAFAVNFANSGVSAFQGDSSITINPTTHTFTAPLFALTGCPAGQFIKGDGTGCAAAAAGNPAGSNTQLQFNSGGIFGATTWTWDGAFINSASDTPTGHQLASANAAVTTYSVLAYGAKADMKPLNAAGIGGQSASFTSGSNIMACTNCFTSSAVDVGKVVSVYSWTAQVFATAPYTATIIGFTDASHVTLSRNASNTTGAQIIYGTDNVPAFVACQNAVQASPIQYGVCTIPAGQYLLGSAPYLHTTGATDSGAYSASAGGSGAVLACTQSGGSWTGCTVSNGGSKYTPNSQLRLVFSGGGCTTSPLSPFDSCGNELGYANSNASGVITSVSVVYGGNGLTSNPTATVTPLGGDGAAATVTLTAGAISGTVVTAPGGGYVPSSTLHVYGINGSGCATISTASNRPDRQATGTATTDATGAVVSIAWSNPGSGCTGAPVPTVLFSDYACNTGTALSPVWDNCSNIAPLSQIQIPVQIPVARGVSWQGVSGPLAGAVSLYGIWDGKTVDNNQPAMFGGAFSYVSISNLNMYADYIGFLATPYLMDHATYSGLNFFTGIGIMTADADQLTVVNNVTFNQYASWVNGGTWCLRNDFPADCGGVFNISSMTNVIPKFLPQSAIGAAIDDWFANNFWGPQYSPVAQDFVEQCNYPQTPANRQTSGNMVTPQVGNFMCYPGLSWSGMDNLTRNGRISGGGTISGLNVKGGFRYLYYGALASYRLTDSSCGEPCGGFSGTDNYRPGTGAQDGVLVVDDESFGQVDDVGIALSGGTFKTCMFGLLQAANTGIPSNTKWRNVQCLGGAITTPLPLENQGFLNAVYAPKGVVSGLTVSGLAGDSSGASSVLLYGRSGGATNTLAGGLIPYFGFGGNALGLLAQDGTTHAVDYSATRWQLNIPSFIQNTLKICNPSSTANCATMLATGLTGNRTVLIPDGASNFIQGAASATAGSVVQYTGTDGVQHYIATPAAIANGTSALGTGAITTLTCATVVTTAASGVLATDTISWAFNAAPGSGWPGLTIQPYPTANNVNFLVCNPTAGSVTPAAATLNWRVGR